MNKTIVTTSRSPTEEETQSLDIRRLNAKAELAHYGVKGMRWGVRKDDYRAKVSRARGYKARRSLTDKDLQKTINRLNLEKQYKKLILEDIAPGRAFVADMLPKIGSAALMAAAGSIGAKLAKEYVKNKLGG